MDENLGLTDAQMAFCDFYLRNSNAGEAYRLAYDFDGEKKLAQGTCYTGGSRLLKKEKVQNYLNMRKREMKHETLMTVEDILTNLENFANDVSIRPADRIRALELLGKHKAMWQDKVNMNNEVEIEINLSGIEEEVNKEVHNEVIVEQKEEEQFERKLGENW